MTSVDNAENRMQSRRLVVAVCLGALSLALYLSTMVRVHEGDALMYADAVRQGTIQGLFHPNHLLYEVVARLNFVLWQYVGWRILQCSNRGCWRGSFQLDSVGPDKESVGR